MSAICSSCAAPMRADDGFCGNCGQAAPPTLALSPAPAKDVPYLPKSSLISADVAGPLDPLFNPRYARQLIRRGLLYIAVTGFFDVVVLVLDLLVSLMRGTAGALAFAPVVWILSLIVVIVVFWVLPVPALLGEWHRLITFRAPKAASTLDYIQEALDRHHTPYDSLRRKPITPPGEGRKRYLELRRGFFAGYVSCFAHGDDLYIGWTFWIYVSPLRVLIMRLGRKVQDYTGRGNDIYQTLRFESTQATITAIQACTLEGVEFATGTPSQSPVEEEAPPEAQAEQVPSVG